MSTVFYNFFFLSQNDSPSKTMKNVFYFTGLPQKMKNKISWHSPDHSTKFRKHFKIIFGWTFKKRRRRPQNTMQCLPLINHRYQKITKQLIKLQIVQTWGFIQWIHCTHTPEQYNFYKYTRTRTQTGPKIIQFVTQHLGITFIP